MAVWIHMQSLMTFLVWLLHQFIQHLTLTHSSLQVPQGRENKAIFALFSSVFWMVSLTGCNSIHTPASWEQHTAHERLLLVSRQANELLLKDSGGGGEKEQNCICDKARVSWCTDCCKLRTPIQRLWFCKEKSMWGVNTCGRIQGTNTSLAHTRKMCCLLKNRVHCRSAQ